jgi:DNA-binding GntR family transcriptional regulator
MFTAGRVPDPGQDVLRHNSLARSAADWIAGHIISGDIEPGQKLTETGLAERMGVSRSPVREALAALSREGLITIEPRRGARVSRLDASDAADLYECRMLIEPRCASLAAGVLSDATAAELDATFEHMTAAVAARDSMEYVEALKRYYAVALAACPNQVLAGMTQNAWRSSLRYWDLLVRGSSTYMADSLAHNERLHKAMRKRSAAEAEQAAIGVLQHGRSELLRILDNLASATADGGAG